MMPHRIDPLGEAGLQFYSKVSASISHEIKNTLAVLNESAGFLEDVTLMARKGMNVDMERLHSLAGSMLKQVQRADTIVKNMNRLAHSLDESWTQVDVNSLLELMKNLSERTTVTRGFNVTVAVSDMPVIIATNPFFLENMIWLLLDFAMTVTGDAKTIEMQTVKADPGARIVFSGLDRLTENKFNDFQTERVRLMLAMLNSTLQTDKNNGMITLNLPGNTESPAQ